MTLYLHMLALYVLLVLAALVARIAAVHIAGWFALHPHGWPVNFLFLAAEFIALVTTLKLAFYLHLATYCIP